jgi:hypothetical protein
MGSILLMSVLTMCNVPPPMTPTPYMRIEQIIEQERMNRAPRILPGTLPYPYPRPPSGYKPFEDYYYSPYYRPYPYYSYPYYWR